MGEQFLHQPLVDTAATSPLTVSIEGFPLASQAPDHGVNRHVAWTGVEGHHVGKRASGRKDCHIADATDIVDDARLLGIAEQEIMDVRGERPPLPPNGHIAWSKVRDCHHPGALRDDRWISKL